MALARGATTMTRLGKPMHTCHGSGRACPCHANNPRFMVEPREGEHFAQEAKCAMLPLRLPTVEAEGFLLSFQLFTPVRKGILLETNKTDEPTNSGPHTNLGFGGNCLFFRPLQGLSLTAHARLRTLLGAIPTERASCLLAS